MRRMLANTLQTLYERNRVPETWGAPHVSGPTFEALRTKGFRAAGKYLFQRLQEVGYQEIPPCHKFLALVAGVILVAIVNTYIRHFLHEERPGVKSYGKRNFSAHVPKWLVALYALGAGLLVLANGDGNEPTRYPYGPNEAELMANPMGYHDGRAHIPQFEKRFLDIYYCSSCLFCSIIAMTKSTRKRAYDLVFALAFENPGFVALPKKSKTGKIGISEGILQ